MIKWIESKKWYHDWQQKARERYLAGYYPGHNRMPNFIVRGLYWIGYFIGDFIPLILNLIDGIYWTIKRLVSFIVGLLIDSSIAIVVIGAVIFSFSHSIERLRHAGATGGMEYIGVLMFEVIFIGSSATLTGLLMNWNWKKPNGFEWFGFIITFLGFGVGIGFVWWSNVNGMAPTWEGKIIGTLVPIIVLIGKGILAYRHLSESKKDEQTKLLEFVQRNGLSAEDALKAVEMYIVTKNGTSEINTRGSNTSNGTSKQDTSDAFTNFDTSIGYTRNDGTSDLNTSGSFTSYADTSNGDTSEANTNIGGTNSVYTSEAHTRIDGTNEPNTSVTTSENDTSEPNTSDANTSNTTSDLNTSTTNTSETGTNETATSDSNTSEEDTSIDTSDAGTNKKPTNVVELAKHTSKRKRTSRRTTWTEEDYQRVREIALQLREQDPKKELPGRPTLKEKAGCKENLARKVLEDLKEELKQTS